MGLEYASAVEVFNTQEVIALSEGAFNWLPRLEFYWNSIICELLGKVFIVYCTLCQ